MEEPLPTNHEIEASNPASIHSVRSKALLSSIEKANTEFSFVFINHSTFNSSGTKIIAYTNKDSFLETI